MRNRCFIVACLAVVHLWGTTAGSAAEPIAIGSRLEPLIDDHLIEKLAGGVALTLHEPVRREVAIVHNEPWEGNVSTGHTVFRDGELYRMYYRGWQLGGEAHPAQVCYAESKDGIQWTKPRLGLVEFRGSKQNNIIWSGVGAVAFSPFKDTNPACSAGQRYKALSWDTTGGEGNNKGLVAFQSADGIHWELMQEAAVITKGDFDSQNLAFWDPTRQCYVAYFRKYRNGLRDVLTSTSTDFLHWSEPTWLKYPGAADEELYTNQIGPYERAPHLLFGFPMRYVASRPSEFKPNSDPAMNGITDGVFMTSRDGLNFHRWGEALIRPGLQADCWVSRNNYTACGILQTKSDLSGTPDELSIYATEGYYLGNSCRLRRFTVRMDGFVSIRASSQGGEMVTRPLTFLGNCLKINYSTSAAGSIRVEILDMDGKPVPGFAMEDCPEIYGDRIEQSISWKSGSDVGKLAGKPIKLRFALKDADLYAFQFRQQEAESR